MAKQGEAAHRVAGSPGGDADKTSAAKAPAANMLAPEIQAALNQLVDAHAYASCNITLLCHFQPKRKAIGFFRALLIPVSATISVPKI